MELLLVVEHMKPICTKVKYYRSIKLFLTKKYENTIPPNLRQSFITESITFQYSMNDSKTRNKKNSLPPIIQRNW